MTARDYTQLTPRKQAVSPTIIPTNFSSDTPIQELKGIGPARGEALGRLGIRTIRDLLLFEPRRHEDRRRRSPIAKARPGQFHVVEGTVTVVRTGRTHRGIPFCEIVLQDESGNLRARWYRQAYLSRSLRVGQQLLLAGRLSPHPPREFANPEHESLEAGDAGTHTGRIVPVYPLTGGLSQRTVRRYAADAARTWSDLLPELLPVEIRQRNDLTSIANAVRGLHIPDAIAEAEAARRRLQFEEAFLFSLGVLRERARRDGEPGIRFAVPAPLSERARASLPFRLTEGQEGALAAIQADMAECRPMRRLLQGDVGCGKTIVAVLAALTAVGSGYQAAILAPTEVLAAQHTDRVRALADPLGVPVVSLTGGQEARTRRTVLKLLAAGTPALAIGTHALLQDDVTFGRLGFIVVDEQHRFGVMQRAALSRKGSNPDVLVMTATPIPRSLALVLYGDLDLSIIEGLPPGRLPVKTIWLDEGARSQIVKGLEARLRRGERAYVVCPVVEEGTEDLAAAVETAAAYRRGPLGQYGVGLLHGRLSAREKLETLQAFRDGRLRLLVATTVVEVGVDVAEATAIVIEHADRLGLAQLHQLRGRVGRADRPGVCVLVADREAVSEVGVARLEALVRERDGFALAETDLRLRGPGQFFGTIQAGRDEGLLGDLVMDLRLLDRARAEAASILAEDPHLTDRWAALAAALESRWAGRFALARIG
jgi:ATP-dependent DNA helicase RecG